MLCPMKTPLNPINPIKSAIFHHHSTSTKLHRNFIETSSEPSPPQPHRSAAEPPRRWPPERKYQVEDFLQKDPLYIYI